MRVCPKCGYIDDFCWRPKSWHTHSEIEICRLCDFQQLSPELARDMIPGKKFLDTVFDKYYAYRISKTGVWVYRRPLIVYKIQGWKDIPAETPQKSKKSQTKLLESVSVQDGKET